MSAAAVLHSTRSSATMTDASAALTLRPASAGDEPLRREWFLADRAAELALPAALLELQWTARAQDWAARHPLAVIHIIEAAGCPVGAVAVDRSAAEGTHLVDLVVAPARRRSGIGSAVLDALCAEGRPLTLTVWAANEAARALYRKHGFVQTGESGGYLALRRPAREESA